MGLGDAVGVRVEVKRLLTYQRQLYDYSAGFHGVIAMEIQHWHSMQTNRYLPYNELPLDPFTGPA